LIGKNARILYPADEDFEHVGTVKYAMIRERGTGTVETRWRCKDGTILDILLSSTPVDLSDIRAGVMFTALDITDRKDSKTRR
jgi:PAS domain S-box-containing protein